MSEHHDSNSAEDTGPCAVCGGTFPTRELRGTAGVRPGIMELIRKDHPGIGSEDHICRADLARYRRLYLEELLEEERGELSELDREVIESIETGELVTQNPEEEIDETMTFGQRMADHVAAFGGSWTFILTFLAVLMGWIAINSLSLLTKPFDPYPYILLNLVLSCIAAIQAPIIMMSQNRQASRDRLSAENDYQVNLKAELEIRAIGEKLDLLIHNQWQRLIEIQQVQMEMLEDLAGKRGK